MRTALNQRFGFTRKKHKYSWITGPCPEVFSIVYPVKVTARKFSYAVFSLIWFGAHYQQLPRTDYSSRIPKPANLSSPSGSGYLYVTENRES